MTDARRRTFLGALAAVAAAAAAAATAGATERAVRRVGILFPEGTEPSDLPRLKAALGQLGWIEGRNLVIDPRYERDVARMGNAASELMRGSPDVLLSFGTSRTRALQRATSTIPIVAWLDDPVAEGFSASLVRPSANITGMAMSADQPEAKQIQLLRELVPGLEHLGNFYPERYVATQREQSARLMAAAAAAGLTLDSFLWRDVRDFSLGFRRLSRHARRAAFLHGLVASPGMEEIAALAIEHRVATFSPDPEFVKAGGLLSYGLDFEDGHRVVAVMIDKALRGVRPSEIPFELPTHSLLWLNRRTARALRIEVPADLLLRADRVIE
jgi:putative ABC transport system substrate-binding protein